MKWSKKTWVALALGTAVTLLSMRIGLLFLRQARGERGDSEEYLWILSNDGDNLGLPLEQSKMFTAYVKGGDSKPHTAAFLRILRDAKAEATFAELARLGPEGARLYGLCGLKTLHSPRLIYYMSLATIDERKVALINGCSLYVQTVRDAVQNPGVWAICEKLSEGALPNQVLQADDHLGGRFAPSVARR